MSRGRGGSKTAATSYCNSPLQTFFSKKVRRKSEVLKMSRYDTKPEKQTRSDTSVAKKQLRSVGYGKESSVAEEGRKEP